jgi:hypothetical protein
MYVKTMSAHGSHLGWRSWSADTILKVYYPRTHADILKRAYLCQVSDTGSPEPLVIFKSKSMFESNDLSKNRTSWVVFLQ